jgi:hypothetical protein
MTSIENPINILTNQGRWRTQTPNNSATEHKCKDFQQSLTKIPKCTNHKNTVQNQEIIKRRRK